LAGRKSVYNAGKKDHQMRLLNLGCGSTRPSEDYWTNLDNLREQHAIGSPERETLDAEPNYIEHDILAAPLPFDENTFDAIALFHCLEHFEAQDGWKLMQNCSHVLKPGGCLMVSVPDASYFRAVDGEDRNENWPRLFGQADPRNPIPTFRQAALFFEQHRVILTEDALWCYFRQAGFEANRIERVIHDVSWVASSVPMASVYQLLSRQLFSLVMVGTK
jgi:predicted SAM-dependent methyltransferase